MESSLILNHDDSSSELPEESLDLEYDDFPLDLVGLPTFDYNSDSFHIDEEDDVWQPNKVQTPLRSSTSGYQSNRNSYLSSVSKNSQRNSVVSTSIREAYALDNDIVFYNNDILRTVQDSIGLDTDSRTLLAPKVDNKDDYEITVITENRNRKGHFRCFTRIAKFFLKKYHPLQKDCSRFEKVKYQLRLPPTGKLSHFLYIILSLTIQWALTYIISPREAAPGGNIFAILVLITSSWVFSKVFRLLTLPGFLGMLTAGILIGNIPLLKNTVYDGLNRTVISIIRQMALACLLLKMGQTFDVGTLRKLTYAVLRLAIFPAFSEITFVTVTSKFLLNFGWLRAVLLG
ncbi:DgyrCDS7095 [Dimorphilus gyrociliatus]|nr:DgyrCDS7095 [Dimorphilus gyrociliatus]